jgi:AcrR family transcriptional regulator
MSKLTFIQIEKARSDAVAGYSVRSIAASLNVTEGAIRYHFRKPDRIHPKVIRWMAWRAACAEMRLVDRS